MKDFRTWIMRELLGQHRGNRCSACSAVVLAAFLVLFGGMADATDQGITGKKLLLTTTKFVLISKDPGINISGSDPVAGDDSSLIFSDGVGSSIIIPLPVGAWRTNGAGTVLKYRDIAAGAWVKVAKVKHGLLKVVGKGFGAPTGAQSLNVELSLDGGTNRYCMTFTGTGDGSRFLVKESTAGTCAAVSGNNARQEAEE